MDTFKFLVFVEFIAMFTCGMAHILYPLIGEGEVFPLAIYPLIAGFTLVITLLAIYIFTPLAEWFFK